MLSRLRIGAAASCRLGARGRGLQAQADAHVAPDRCSGVLCGRPVSPCGSGRVLGRRHYGTCGPAAAAPASVDALRPTSRQARRYSAEAGERARAEAIRAKATPPRPNAFPVYMDLQATTPLDPRVLDAMLPYMTEKFGNPHSRTHAYGWEAEAAAEEARRRVAALIGADARDIVFTSGATESNNIAIKGVARFYRQAEESRAGADAAGAARPKSHIVTTQIEHKCVLDACRQLEQDEGFRVTYVAVDADGRVDPAAVEAAIVPGETVLVSVMAVNNEIGVTQPLAEIGAACRRHGVFLHTDAAQAAGKIPLDVDALGVDLLSISGHKLYGPKGVGALYVRRRPRVRVAALQSGGGQERGIRSGTVPVPLVVGLGEACALAAAEMGADTAHVARLTALLVDEIARRVPCVTRNGSATHAVPGCVNLSFAHVEGESLLMALKDVALSSGSACTSASLEPSYVLRALGKDDVLAHSSLRFGLGRFTTDAEVEYVVRLVTEHVARLRELSPLWEMVQEGIDLNTIEWSGH